MRLIDGPAIWLRQWGGKLRAQAADYRRSYPQANPALRGRLDQAAAALEGAAKALEGQADAFGLERWQVGSDRLNEIRARHAAWVQIPGDADPVSIRASLEAVLLHEAFLMMASHAPEDVAWLVGEVEGRGRSIDALSGACIAMQAERDAALAEVERLRAGPSEREVAEAHRLRAARCGEALDEARAEVSRVEAAAQPFVTALHQLDPWAAELIGRGAVRDWHGWRLNGVRVIGPVRMPDNKVYGWHASMDGLPVVKGTPAYRTEPEAARVILSELGRPMRAGGSGV